MKGPSYTNIYEFICVHTHTQLKHTYLNGMFANIFSSVSFFSAAFDELN